MKNFFGMSKEEVLKFVESNERGLTGVEAVQRIEKNGYNEIAEGKRKSAFFVFLEQFKDFLVIILLFAATISAFLGDVESSLVIFVVVIINAILGTVQHMKAEQSLNSLKEMSAPIAKVLRDGDKIEVPSREVTLGDIVFLEAGDYICADGRIIENFSLKVNESSLTGESISVDKTDDIISGVDVPIGDRINMVHCGNFVTYGRATFVVTGIGMDTELGKVAQLIKDTKEKKTPLQVNLDNFGKKLSIIILIICAALFALSVYRGEDIVNAFMFAVALAVAAIPEALASIVTIVLSIGTQKMAKENAIIRKLQAVEGLGSISIICSDKTGTLTQNKMTVQKLCVNNKIIEKTAFSTKNELEKALLMMSVLCNDSTNVNGKEMGDPTEVALINFAKMVNYEERDVRIRYKRLHEIPFDSDRKLMSTVHNFDGKNVMIVKGAVDVLFNRVTSIIKDSGTSTITDDDKTELNKINNEFSNSGLRVLAFAFKELKDDISITLDSENDLTFLGLISMMDPPRPESKKAVEKCIKASIKPIMITGDHKATASAIARQIGILTDSGRAVDGSEIENLTDEELMTFVEDVSVYARVSPEHKIRIVKAWQDKGNIVSMTGDGVNDAPALKQANIGVAMGITGSEVAKDAASMVLTDDNFATIIKAIENGRNVYANIKNSIKFLLSGNTAGIIVVLYASFMALPVPFAAVHLLFINLLTDSLPAIALGVEPHSSDVMKEKPRPLNESILTKDFMFDVILEGIIISISTIIAFYIGLDKGGAPLGSTMAFATLCICRLVHSFNSKSKRAILFTKKMFNNGYLWGAFFVGFIALNAVLLVPFLQNIFAVVSLGNLIFTIYALSLVPLITIQGIKLILHK